MITETRSYDSGEERTILTAMIVSDPVLTHIAANMKGVESPFRSKWSNIVSEWCLGYFNHYHRAPRKAIRTLFEKHARSTRDKESIETIESFLEGLSREYSGKDLNEQFIIDTASKHFRRVRLEKLARSIESALEKDDTDKAETCLAEHHNVAFSSSDWVDPTDPKILMDSLSAAERQSVLGFRGDLNTFLSPYFERDGFVSFVGPEKRGKSFWLLECAWQGMRQRRRVLYYVVGDMSRPQVIRRLVIRAIRRPFKAGPFDRPKKIKRVDGKMVVLHEQMMANEDISVSRAAKAMREALERAGSKESRLKLKCVSPSSLSASDIERDVRSFSRQGWIPDMVVVDYADLLAPEPHTLQWDFRHQENEKWKILRRVSQDFHLLVLTATQAAATAYNSPVVRKTDFSEDKRKNAHVTGMLGINQTSEEKQQGIYRLNWTFLRDGAWTDTQVCHTAGNLALACPCIVSRL